MLLKMVLNNNDNTKTFIWSNMPADIVDYFNFNYCGYEKKYARTRSNYIPQRPYHRI